VGDLLFSCPAYAYVLTVNERGNHCEYCFARKEGLSKCGRCKQAFYCNVECQKEDWPMHKLECSPMVVFGENWNPSETVRLTARILAKQQMHPERTPSEKLLAVKEFESHLDKLDNEKKDLIQSDIAALHHFYSKHLEFPDSDSLVVLFAQVNCNGFTVEDEELSHLGSAIFPDVALMNHKKKKKETVVCRAWQGQLISYSVLVAGVDLLSRWPTHMAGKWILVLGVSRCRHLWAAWASSQHGGWVPRLSIRRDRKWKLQKPLVF